MNDVSSSERRYFRFLKLPIYLWSIVFIFGSLLYIIGISFFSKDSNGSLVATGTLSNYSRLVSPVYLGVLWESIKQAFISTILCMLIGYPFGYFMSRLPRGKRTTVLLLLMVPFWTNALIRIYGWRILLMAGGPLDSILKTIGLIQEPLRFLYTGGAVQLGMVYALLPFMILPSFNACEKLDMSIVEAARDLGAKPFYAFLTVTVPLTSSGLLAGSVLVFIPSMGMFFLNDLLGGSTTVMLGSLIQKLINSRDLPMAAALSVLLLAATVSVLAVYHRLGGKDQMLF